MGSHSLERGCRKEVPDMNLRLECFSLERRWQFRFKQHWWNVICHGAICTLCYSILLWSVSSGMPPMDPTIISELGMLWTYTLPPCHPRIPSSWCWSGSQKMTCRSWMPQMHHALLELRSCFVWSCIINKGHPVAISFRCSNWEWAVHIWINKLKWLSGNTWSEGQTSY